MQPQEHNRVIHPSSVAAGRAALDELARLALRQEIKRAGRSISEMARVLGIEQGPASRRLKNGYAWKHSDLVLLGEWLGVDIVAEINNMWRAVRGDASIMGAVRADDGGSGGEPVGGPVRQGRRGRPAA